MGQTVLIADDDALNLEMLVGLVESLGAAALTAADGLAACARAAEARPDLILLDGDMPGLSGYEVCQKLRADPAFQNTPIILLTASVQMGQRRKALNAGADDFFLKPFDLLALRERVAEALGLTPG